MFYWPSLWKPLRSLVGSSCVGSLSGPKIDVAVCHTMPILALLSHLFLPQQEQSLWRTCLAWLRGRVAASYLLSSEVRPNAARRAMPYMQTYIRTRAHGGGARISLARRCALLCTRKKIILTTTEEPGWLTGHLLLCMTKE